MGKGEQPASLVLTQTTAEEQKKGAVAEVLDAENASTVTPPADESREQTAEGNVVEACIFCRGVGQHWSGRRACEPCAGTGRAKTLQGASAVQQEQQEQQEQQRQGEQDEQREQEDSSVRIEEEVA